MSKRLLARLMRSRTDKYRLAFAGKSFGDRCWRLEVKMFGTNKFLFLFHIYEDEMYD